LFEFFALLTHGSPLTGRERAALSVTDDCREQGDDEPTLSHDPALRHCSFGGTAWNYGSGTNGNPARLRSLLCPTAAVAWP
jgi:hypothetical protein